MHCHCPILGYVSPIVCSSKARHNEHAWESLALKVSRRKIWPVFERYNIVDRHGMEQAMEKVAEFHRIEDAKPEQATTRPI